MRKCVSRFVPECRFANAKMRFGCGPTGSTLVSFLDPQFGLSTAKVVLATFLSPKLDTVTVFERQTRPLYANCDEFCPRSHPGCSFPKNFSEKHSESRFIDPFVLYYNFCRIDLLIIEKYFDSVD